MGCYQTANDKNDLNRTFEGTDIFFCTVFRYFKSFFSPILESRNFFNIFQHKTIIEMCALCSPVLMIYVRNCELNYM